MNRRFSRWLADSPLLLLHWCCPSHVSVHFRRLLLTIFGSMRSWRYDIASTSLWRTYCIRSEIRLSLSADSETPLHPNNLDSTFSRILVATPIEDIVLAMDHAVQLLHWLYCSFHLQLCTAWTLHLQHRQQCATDWLQSCIRLCFWHSAGRRTADLAHWKTQTVNATCQHVADAASIHSHHTACCLAPLYSPVNRFYMDTLPWCVYEHLYSPVAEIHYTGKARPTHKQAKIHLKHTKR